jgi:hypothetical protein
MNATPAPRPQHDPPGREQVEQMISALRDQLAVDSDPGSAVGAQYWQACINALLWVLGDPDFTHAPVTDRVLGRPPTPSEIYQEMRAADDVLFSRRPRPHEAMTQRQLQGYEGTLFWASVGREPPVDL